MTTNDFDIDDRNAVTRDNPLHSYGWLGRWTHIALIAAIVVLAATLIWLIARYVQTRSSLIESAQAGATLQAQEAANDLSEIFANSMATAEDIAGELTFGALPYDQIADRLQSEMDADPTIDGITVAFATGAYSDDYDHYIVYLHRDETGKITVEERESDYDYTLPPSDDASAPQTAWYHNPITLGPTWTDPFVATGAGKVLIEYGAPFFTGLGSDAEPAGVVAIDYSLENMRQLVANLDLGATGYGTVYSQSGAYLAHPVPELVANTTIFERFIQLDEPEAVDAAQRALAGDTLTFTRLAPATGQDVWDFFTPIPSTGWALMLELSARDILPSGSEVLVRQTTILLVGAALLFLVIALALRAYIPTRQRLWALSLAFSAIAVVSIVATILLARSAPLTYGVAITNRTELDRYVEQLRQQYAEFGYGPLVEIPTGMLIQSIRFPDTTSVAVNGYLWQHIPHGQDLQDGVMMPQRIDEPWVMDEILRQEMEDSTLVVWSFNAALRQAFDPVQYPFDRYDINIRMLPTELAQNVLLTPDLESYNVTVPSLLPGLEEGVRINNWRVLATSYAFVHKWLNTNLGLPGRPAADVPELNFAIRTNRIFVGPFIAFLLPALVAGVMVFGYLLNGNKPDEPEEIVTALSYTAALFFVIAVVHATLRESAAAIGLTYLEYLYLFLYVAILLVAANTFVFVRYPNFPLVRYGDNLISKLLYWPTLLAGMLAVTVWIFVFRSG